MPKQLFFLLAISFAIVSNPLASCMILAQSTKEVALKKEGPIVVIAHRGASGYLPEHTEGAKVLALAQGADYIEQDVVLSKDHVFVVSHDITMEETTDVAERFPDRKRSDGRFYFADFSWSEIQTVSVHERTSRKTDKQVFANRFPGSFHQRLMRLEDEIKLVQGWNKSAQRKAGIYVELKSPAWHQKEFGYPMGEKLLALLDELGYRTKSDLCFVQCFEPEELKRLKSKGCPLRLIQLTGGRPKGENNGWQSYVTEVAAYADGIGPSIDLLVTVRDGEVKSSGLVEAAHEAKLQVHPYTVRADQLPAWSGSIDRLHQLLIHELKVDGFFTDFPDLGRAACDRPKVN